MEKMPSMPSARNQGASSKLKRQETGAGRLTLILVVISLALFTMSVREGDEGPLHAVRNVTQTIVSPLRMLGGVVVSPFASIGNIYRNLTADEATLSELKDENERLYARNVELEESELTAQRLQALLDLQSTYNLQSVAASVISGSTDSWTQTVTIDKGSGAGITVGMPVVDANGAVGQVIAVAASTSTVRLITDEASSISAMVQKTRAQGMLEGSIAGELHLAYIRTDQTVDVGDIVVTSGLGGVFPKGLPLGRVSVIDSTPGSSYYEIVIEPYANPNLLEEVVVVTSLTEGQEATAEDIEVADAADLAAAGGTPAADEDADKKDGDAEGAEGAQAEGLEGEEGQEGQESLEGEESWDGSTDAGEEV